MFQYNFVNSHKATIALVVETTEAFNGDNYVLGRVVGTIGVTPWTPEVPAEATKESVANAAIINECTPWTIGQDPFGEVTPLPGTYNGRLWFIGRSIPQPPYQEPQYETALLYIPDNSLYINGGLGQIVEDLNAYRKNHREPIDENDQRLAFFLHHDEIELNHKTFIHRLDQLIEAIVYSMFKNVYDLHRQYLAQLSAVKQLGYEYTAQRGSEQELNYIYAKENPILPNVEKVLKEDTNVQWRVGSSRPVTSAAYLRFFLHRF